MGTTMWTLYRKVNIRVEEFQVTASEVRKAQDDERVVLDGASEHYCFHALRW